MKTAGTILISAMVAVIATGALIQMGALNYPLDPKDQEIIRKAIKDEMGSFVRDAIWKNVYYYSFMADSLDGVSLQGNAPTIDDTGITMATAAVLNSTSIIVKGGIAQKVLTFGKKQSFRISLEFSTVSLANVESHFSTGLFGIGENYYGFETSGATLKGSSSNDFHTVASNAITLDTLVVNTTYELEARLDPDAKRVVFLVNGVEKGNLTTEIPSGINSSGGMIENGNFFDWYIKTTNTAAKTVVIGNFEFIQERYTKN